MRNYYNKKDSLPIGSRISPPFFYGVFFKWQSIKGNPFAHAGYLEHCRYIIRFIESPTSFSFLNQLIKKIFALYFPKHLSLPLSKIKEMLLSKKNVRVLDIGGGYGDNFFFISRALSSSINNVYYDVVDNKSQRDLGKNFWGGKDFNINFFRDIPNKKYDIILIIGTLQYIKNWKTFLLSVMPVSSKYIYISRSPIIVNRSSFISIQSISPRFGSWKGKKIGQANVNVISEIELNSIFKATYALESSNFNRDYSKNFSRLPLQYANIIYLDKLWRRL